MNTRIIRFLLGTTTALTIALLLLARQVPMPVSSAPTTIYSVTVSTVNDEYDMSGSSTGCSLREAIKTANDSLDFGGCTRAVAGDVSGPDTILLPSGTYTLTLTGAVEDLDATGDLDIRKSSTISATGATMPVVAGGASWADRIFHVLTGTVTFKGIAIRGGQAVAASGGGVRIESGTSLTLNDSEVTSSIASVGIGGGISNSGALTLTNSTLSGNSAGGGGGGIHNVGTATLTNVTLSGNSVPYCYFCGGLGGGISNSGALTLTNVTLISNSAFNNGGGIYNYFGTVKLTNVTLSGNSATYGGGIYHLNATTKLVNVTFSGNSATTNGGGISAGGGSMSLTNTIVANSPFGGNCAGSLGSSFNLSSDNTCAFGLGRDNISVMLAPLGNYGGPTLTHMLKPGSPAIDFGTNTGCPSDDQRGKSRLVNTCDVGAVERQPIDFSYWLNLPLILK